MEKRYLLTILFLLFFLAIINRYPQQLEAKLLKARIGAAQPEIPRVSAYEAYLKCSSGKAILLHAGGMSYKNRHVMGSINAPNQPIQKGEYKLPRLPKEGIEIFTYCY